MGRWSKAISSHLYYTLGNSELKSKLCARICCFPAQIMSAISMNTIMRSFHNVDMIPSRISSMTRVLSGSASGCRYSGFLVRRQFLLWTAKIAPPTQVLSIAISQSAYFRFNQLNPVTTWAERCFRAMWLTESKIYSF